MMTTEEPARLAKLPLELLLHITSSLDLVDTICLALTSHHFHHQIGQSPFLRLCKFKQPRRTPPADDYSSSSEDEIDVLFGYTPRVVPLYRATKDDEEVLTLRRARQVLLQRLAGDLKGHFTYCDFCVRLHPDSVTSKLREECSHDDLNVVIGAVQTFDQLIITSKAVKTLESRKYCTAQLLQLSPSTSKPSETPSTEIPTTTQRLRHEGFNLHFAARTECNEENDPPHNSTSVKCAFRFSIPETAIDASSSTNRLTPAQVAHHEELVSAIWGSQQGFRICNHLSWSSDPWLSGSPLPDVNNYAWLQFQKPLVRSHISSGTAEDSLRCPICDAKFRIQRSVSELFIQVTLKFGRDERMREGGRAWGYVFDEMRDDHPALQYRPRYLEGPSRSLLTRVRSGLRQVRWAFER